MYAYSLPVLTLGNPQRRAMGGMLQRKDASFYRSRIHVVFMVYGVALSRLCFEFFVQLSLTNHHSTVAPYKSIALTRQHSAPSFCKQWASSLAVTSCRLREVRYWSQTRKEIFCRWYWYRKFRWVKSTILKWNKICTQSVTNIFLFYCFKCWRRRSQWPRSLRRRSTAARLLRLWVRIPPGAWVSFCCEFRVLSDKGLCDGLITRPDEAYRLWCVAVCVTETSSTSSQTSISSNWT